MKQTAQFPESGNGTMRPGAVIARGHTLCVVAAVLTGSFVAVPIVRDPPEEYRGDVEIEPIAAGFGMIRPVARARFVRQQPATEGEAIGAVSATELAAIQHAVANEMRDRAYRPERQPWTNLAGLPA